MEFDSVYTVHCSLRLETGREVTLDKLTQTRTYAGLLEGTPNKKSNDLAIQWALEQAKRNNELLEVPYLIEPQRQDYLRERGDMQQVIDRQHELPEEMKHIPEWLPQIECVGVFSSIHPVRDKTKVSSSLTILWYQDDFGFDEAAIQRLRRVDWDQYATDWEY